jgi:hypothetical protein
MSRNEFEKKNFYSLFLRRKWFCFDLIFSGMEFELRASYL